MILLLSSHMYVLIFKTYPSMKYICSTIGLYAISVDCCFLGGFYFFFGIAEAVFTGHVWPLAQTYPALGFLGYINGVGYPLES
jgi:hypothetical protein